MTHLIRPAALAVSMLLAAGSASAQATAYRARLTPVPITAQMASTVKGIGAATAVLKGTTLSITGSFDGLATPATAARVHIGMKTGVRGPEAFTLQVSSSTSGTISGTLQLSKEQLNDLAQGRMYVQIDSQKAPEGNLWGWLLPEKK